MICIHPDAKAHPQHPLFAWRQTGQDPSCSFLQVFLNRAVEWQNSVFILNKITQLRIFLIANWRLQGNWLFGNFHDLAHFFQRHLQLGCQFLWRGFTANFMQHLAPGTHQLVDRFYHMHRNTDGARLVCNRAGDRLANPPCGVGGELIAAAIFKLIDRFHEANIALLDQIQKLQPAICVFFGNGNHQTQIGLNHFFLGLTGLFLTFLHLLHNAAEFGDIEPNILANLRHLCAELFNFVDTTLHEHGPAPARFLAHIGQPVGIQLATTIGIDKLTAVDPRLVCEFHHGAVNRHDPAINAVELVNQRLNPVVVQVQFIHQLNNFRAELLIFGLGPIGETLILVQSGRDTHILHLG